MLIPLSQCICIEINWCTGESITILVSLPHLKYQRVFFFYINVIQYISFGRKGSNQFETCVGWQCSWQQRTEFLLCFSRTRNTCPDASESVTHIICIQNLKSAGVTHNALQRYMPALYRALFYNKLPGASESYAGITTWIL